MTKLSKATHFQHVAYYSEYPEEGMCPLGDEVTANALGEGRERGILREASSGEAATSTDGLEGGNGELK